MASIKYNYGGERTLWSSTTKITSPSLCLNDNGTIRYTPLFSGNALGTAYNGLYGYTLGHLVVGGKRVALSRFQAYVTNTAHARLYNGSYSVPQYTDDTYHLYIGTIYYTRIYITDISGTSNNGTSFLGVVANGALRGNGNLVYAWDSWSGYATGSFGVYAQFRGTNGSTYNSNSADYPIQWDYSYDFSSSNIWCG